MDSSLPLSRKKNNRTLFRCVLRGVLSALALMLLLLLGAAAFAYSSNDPSAKIKPLSYAIMLLVAFFAGLISARLRGRQGLFCGFFSGIALLLLFALGYLSFVGEAEVAFLPLLLSYLLMLALSLLGGMLGTASSTGSKRRSHRIKRH